MKISYLALLGSGLILKLGWNIDFVGLKLLKIVYELFLLDWFGSYL